MNATQLNLLAIDTATEACSVALNLRGAVTQQLEVTPNGHSKLVLGMVQSLLRDAGLDLAELDALAVDIGPGSFTGVRIGIGVAQGLAYGAGLKVIAVGSLETLAGAACGETVLAAIDARMGQVYYGLYDNHQPSDAPTHAPRVIIQPALSAPESLVIGSEKRIVGVGSAWDRYGSVMRDALNGSVSSFLSGRYPEAATVSRIAGLRGLSCACSPLQLSAAYVYDEVAQRSSANGSRLIDVADTD